MHMHETHVGVECSRDAAEDAVVLLCDGDNEARLRCGMCVGVPMGKVGGLLQNCGSIAVLLRQHRGVLQ
jgi:hypothetical protein